MFVLRFFLKLYFLSGLTAKTESYMVLGCIHLEETHNVAPGNRCKLSGQNLGPPHEPVLR